MSKIAELTQSLVAWFEENLPAIAADLNPGASPAALASLEAKIGQALPPEAREFYQLHDGQKGEAPGFFYGLEFLALNQVANQWQTWADIVADDPELPGSIPGSSTPPGAIREVYVDLAWIPVAHDFSGNHLALDLNPGPQGQRGQVINYGPDENDKYVLAPSLTDFLHWFYRELEASNFRTDNDWFSPKDPPVDHFFDALPEILEP